jgi:hypothetical protein
MLGNQLWDGASGIDWIVARLLMVGFILGYSSHLFLDSINPSGIHLIPGMKIRFVPRTSFFATDGPWERRIIYPLCIAVSAVVAFTTVLSLADINLWEILITLKNGV